MCSNFRNRPITRITFKEYRKIETLLIEQLVISTNYKNHDIGAWCYKQRGKNLKKGRGTAVELSTFDNTRPAKLKPVVDCLIDEISHLSDGSQSDHLYRLMYFLNWCDENDQSGVLTDEISSKKAYKAYCDMFSDRCLRGKIKQRSAARYQATLLTIFQMLYSNVLFGDGVRVFKAKRTTDDLTQAQDEHEQASVVAWCQAVFDGFSDFVLTEQAFPFQLAIPKNRDWPIEHLWVFPSTTMIMTPDTLAKRNTLKRGRWAYDYANGKLNEQKVINNCYVGAINPEYSAKRALRVADKTISLANNDLRHFQRKRLANIASQAFLHLLYAFSGQNTTPILSMRWPEEYEIGAERQGFRVIKNRGQKGEVLFELHRKFLPTFRKYIILREWILKDSEKTDLLFVSLGRRFTQHPRRMVTATSKFTKVLKDIGIDLPAFGSRQFRANKNEYANDHTDLATAAAAANHSLKTHKVSYMSGTQAKHATELSNFFTAVVKSATEDQVSDKQVGFGSCEDPGNPDPLQVNTKISPKCGRPDGCLFCNNFYIHADEQDIRKLASGRYVIQRTRHLVNSPEEFETLYDPVLEQISGLLNEIAERSKELKKLVARVIQEVNEEENLSEFWASELHYLIDLELINE